MIGYGISKAFASVCAICVVDVHAGGLLHCVCLMLQTYLIVLAYCARIRTRRSFHWLMQL